MAIALVEQRVERLRAILESEQTMPEEKFKALVDLAHLAGMVLREMAGAEGVPGQAR